MVCTAQIDSPCEYKNGEKCDTHLGLSSLSDGLVLRLLSYLSPLTLLTVGQTNKHLNTLSHENVLWKGLCQSIYPSTIFLHKQSQDSTTPKEWMNIFKNAKEQKKRHLHKLQQQKATKQSLQPSNIVNASTIAADFALMESALQLQAKTSCAEKVTSQQATTLPVGHANTSNELALKSSIRHRPGHSPLQHSPFVSNNNNQPLHSLHHTTHNIHTHTGNAQALSPALHHPPPRKRQRSVAQSVGSSEGFKAPQEIPVNSNPQLHAHVSSYRHSAPDKSYVSITLTKKEKKDYYATLSIRSDVIWKDKWKCIAREWRRVRNFDDVDSEVLSLLGKRSGQCNQSYLRELERRNVTRAVEKEVSAGDASASRLGLRESLEHDCSLLACELEIIDVVNLCKKSGKYHVCGNQCDLANRDGDELAVCPVTALCIDLLQCETGVECIDVDAEEEERLMCMG